jgi:hypothetical protein
MYDIQIFIFIPFQIKILELKFIKTILPGLALLFFVFFSDSGFPSNSFCLREFTVFNFNSLTVTLSPSLK